MSPHVRSSFTLLVAALGVSSSVAAQSTLPVTPAQTVSPQTVSPPPAVAPPLVDMDLVRRLEQRVNELEVQSTENKRLAAEKAAAEKKAADDKAAAEAKQKRDDEAETKAHPAPFAFGDFSWAPGAYAPSESPQMGPAYGRVSRRRRLPL